MIEVAAFMITMNFLACAETSAAASAFGVSDEAGEDVDLVAHDQLLRQALGDVGRDAAGVLADDLDLLAGDGVAVLLHVELDAVVHLRAGIGELARIGHDQADLDGLLGARRHGGEERGGEAAEVQSGSLRIVFLLEASARTALAWTERAAAMRPPVANSASDPAAHFFIARLHRILDVLDLVERTLRGSPPTFCDSRM